MIEVTFDAGGLDAICELFAKFETTITELQIASAKLQARVVELENASIKIALTVESPIAMAQTASLIPSAPKTLGANPVVILAIPDRHYARAPSQIFTSPSLWGLSRLRHWSGRPASHCRRKTLSF